MRRLVVIFSIVVCVLSPARLAAAINLPFHGRSGDAIEINFLALPGVSPGSTFSGLNTSGFSGHTVLTSDTLLGQSFASTGRLWVFANPSRNTAALGDTNTAARGFQGTLAGSVLVNGVSKSFSVAVLPGYTGSGPGSVGQNGERIDGSANNTLFVAQQQQRLRYLGFVPDGGTQLTVDGDFGPRTDQATKTFQAAFVAGVNTTQADVDGIIGPNTAAWLNAANAPTWNELIDPDPQTPGSFSNNTMIGNFDIYPGADPGTGARSGLTPQPERFATSWTIDLIKKGSALAKSYTGRTQRVNALSMADGYSSDCCHSTHLVGMDIDLYTNSSTWNWGDGVRSAEEQRVIDHARGFINANAQGRVIRIITSNDDIFDGIAALNPTVPLYFDTSGAHQNHLHIDVGAPTRLAGVANLQGDFNLNNTVSATDYVLWRMGEGVMYTDAHYNTWKSEYGRTWQGPSPPTVLAIPEPMAPGLLLCGAIGWLLVRGRRR